MANKEEIIFKVKAELAGFKKSMDELKKMAKESSKNIEKSMDMNLSDEGKKAGKSFSTGLNSQMKAATDSVKNELKKLSEQASDIKIDFNTSGIDNIKRQLTDMSVNVSTASDRASSSMNNNANAPNGLNAVNAIVSAANAASISKMGDAMGSVGNTIKTTADNMNKGVSDASKTIDKELALKRKIRQISEDLKLLDVFIKKSEESLKSFKQEIEETERELNSLDPSSQEYAELNEKLKGLREEYDIAKKVIKDANVNFAKQQSTLASLKNSLDGVKGTIEELNKIRANGSDNQANQKEIESQLRAAEMLKNALLRAREAGNDRAASGYEQALSEKINKIKELGYSGEKLAPLLKAINQEFKDTSGIKSLANLLSVLANAFKKLSISLPLNIISKTGRTIDKMLTEPLNVAGDVINKLGNELSNLGIKVLNPINAFKALGRVVGSTLKDWGSDAWSKMSNAAKNAGQIIQNTASKIGNAFSNIKGAIASIPGAIKNLPNTIKSAVGSADNIIKNLGNSISNLGAKLKSFVKNPAASIKSAFYSIRPSGDVDAANKQLKEYGNKLKEIKKTIKDFGKDVKNTFSNLGNVVNKILHPIKSIGDSAKKAGSGFRHMGDEANIASGKIGKLRGTFSSLLGKFAMFFGIYEMFNLFKDGTKDAMKYEAAIINLQRTFGKSSDILIDFANNHAVAFGLSKKQVAEYGNIFSVIMNDVNRTMAVMSGTNESSDDIAKKTMGMSKDLLKAAGLISNSLGYEMEYVLEGLRSGLLGSSEAVDQFGLALKDANLKQSETFRLLQKQTGVESWEKLSEAQKQYVRTQEIINQATAKFGNLLDKNGKMMQTTTSLHNQFMAQWANTKLAIGNLGKVIWTAILPPLTKILSVLEVVFNYAAGALTAILESLGIHVDLAANLGGSKELENNLGGLDDTASDTSDAIGSVGDSAQDTAKDTEDAAKKIKRALAGFDQINVLSLGEDNEDSTDPIDNIPDLGDWSPTPLDPGDFGVDIPKFTADTDGLKELLNNLKGIFEEFLEPLKAAWDLLGDRWIAAWDRLKASFKNFCDALSDFLVSVWNNGGKEFVQHMAEIALAVGIAAMEIGGTILDSLAKLWKHLDPSTNINTKGLLDALNEVSVKIRDLILDLNGHFESLMNNGGQDVLNALGDMFMNLGEAAVRGVGIVIDAIDGLLDHLDPATNKKTKGALGGLEYLFKSIGQFALGLTDAFKTFMDNGGQDFLNNMGDIVMILIDLGATIAGDILNAITAFFDSWAGHVVITVAGRALELVSSILKGLLEILEPLTPIISGVVAAIGGFMVASKVVGFVTTIVSAFQSLGPIFAVVKAGAVALWGVLAANPVAAVVAAIIGIGVALVAAYNKCEWFRDAVNKVFERIAEPIQKLKETFSKIFEDIVDVFQNIIDFIVGIFTGDGERAGKAVREFVINIGEILLGLFELKKNLFELGWKLILGLVEGIWECIKNIPQLLAGVAEFIFDFFVGLFGLSPETAEKIKQSGRDMVDSLCQGVMDAISAIGDFFGAIGDAIKQGIDNITSAEWWSDLGKAIAQPFIDVKDFIAELLGDIGSSISEWFSNKIDEALEKLGKIKVFLSDVGKSAKEALNDLREWASGLPEAIGNALSNLKTSIVEGPIGDLVRAIGDKLGEIKDVVSERFEIATKNASEKWGELTEELSGVLDDFIERNKERWERIKQDTAKKLEPITNEVIDKYTNMKDETCKALDDLMAKSEEAWAAVKEKIMEKLEPVVEYISGVWNRTKDAVVGAWEEITTNVSEAWDRFKDACMEVWDGIVEYMSGVWNRTKEAWIGAWNEIKEECGAAWDRVSEECIETWNETCEYLNGVWNRTKEAWVGAWNEIKEECSAAWSRVSEECINIWNDATEYLEGVWNRIRDAWIGAWEEIKTECVAAWDRFSEECIDIWNNACDYVSGVWNRTKEAWIDAWNTIKEECTAAWDRVSSECIDMWNNACDYLNGVWNRTKDAWIDAWSVIKEECGAAWSRVSEECKDMWDNTCEYISGVWNRTKDAWIDAWNVIEQECMAAWDRVSEECKRIWDNTCDYLEGVWDRTKDAWIDAWNVIVEESKAAWDRFSEECANIFGNIADVIVDKLSAISDFFTNLWEDIENLFGSMADGVLDIVGPKWDAVIDFFANIGSKIAGGLLIIPGMIKDLFNFDIFEPIKNSLETGLDKLKDGAGLVEKAYSIGQFLIEGLLDGISTGVEAIGTFISGICDIIIGFFKDLFGIHSPSTVFAELGVYLIEGLMQGIENSVPSLEDIFNGVSDAISGAWDKVENAWSGASDFFSGIGDTVKGVLDTIKNTSIPKPKIEWDSVKESASKIVDNIKTTVQRFKADLPKPKVSWNDLTTSLSKILDSLKRTISNFKWELPKPKLPKFSVSGGQAPWGFMGKGSMPKIDIKWFKTGGIMTSATLFGMSGNTLLGGGEAGAEAILPLDELWSRLDNHFNQQNALLRSTVANSNGNNSNRPVNIVLKVNDIEMGKAVVSSLKALSNHSGTLDLPLR